MTDEYPKMPSVRLHDGRVVNLHFPYGVKHPKEGQPVVFANEQQEREYYEAGAPGVASSPLTDVVENRNHPSYKDNRR